MTKLVDLSQEIFEGMQVWPGHHKTIIWDHATHEETKSQFSNGMSYEARVLLMSEHCGTHTDAVYEIDPDAPKIDRMPMKWFYGDAVCLDLSETKPKAYISVPQLEKALSRSGQEIRKGDILLLYTGHYNRTHGKPAYLTDHPGLDEAGTRWLAAKGPVNIGVDAPTPDNVIDPDISVHKVMKELGTFTITEHLANLDKVANKRFKYYGFPLKIRAGTGAPIRAIAFID